MAKIHFKDLEEADLALAQFVETYSTDRMGGELVSARALLPLFATVRMLVEEVQVLKIKANYIQPPAPPMM